MNAPRDPLAGLLTAWEARAAQALPADAMLINRHVRELREAMASASEHGGGGEAVAIAAGKLRLVGRRMDSLCWNIASAFNAGTAGQLAFPKEYRDAAVECYTAWREAEKAYEAAQRGTTPPTPSAPVGLGVVDELLTNIKRSCVRGRNAADPTPENSSFIATFDHIEDLAQQARRALSGSAPVGVDAIARLAQGDYSLEFYGPGNHGGKLPWLVAVRDNLTDTADEYEGQTVNAALAAALTPAATYATPDDVALNMGPDDVPRLLIAGAPVARFPKGSWTEVCEAFDFGGYRNEQPAAIPEGDNT